MAGPTVQIDAGRTQRGLVPAGAKRARVVDPVKSLWTGLIHHAVQDAKRTRDGLPTAIALLQREWIARQDDPSSTSFAVACGWLSWDVEKERARLLATVTAHWKTALEEWAQGVVRERRAAVLSCAGQRFPGVKRVTVGRQYVLPLVSEAEYETVAGVEHGDPKGWGERKRKKAATSGARKASSRRLSQCAPGC